MFIQSSINRVEFGTMKEFDAIPTESIPHVIRKCAALFFLGMWKQTSMTKDGVRWTWGR